MYLDRTATIDANTSYSSSNPGTTAGPLRLRWAPRQRTDGTTTLVARWTR